MQHASEAQRASGVPADVAGACAPPMRRICPVKDVVRTVALIIAGLPPEALAAAKDGEEDAAGDNDDVAAADEDADKFSLVLSETRP